MQIGKKSIRLNPNDSGQFLNPNDAEVGIIRVENSV